MVACGDGGGGRRGEGAVEGAGEALKLVEIESLGMCAGREGGGLGEEGEGCFGGIG